MRLARPLLAASLLLLTAAALAPNAAATLDDEVRSCVSYKGGGCGGDAVVLDAAGHHLEACAIGVNGSCEPYDGDLVRVGADGKEYAVPDPCYTTACF